MPKTKTKRRAKHRLIHMFEVEGTYEYEFRIEVPAQNPREAERMAEWFLRSGGYTRDITFPNGERIRLVYCERNGDQIEVHNTTKSE